MPLRATALIDAPEGAVRRALLRTDIWTRTARALDAHADVAGDRVGPRAPLRTGDLIRISRHPGSAGRAVAAAAIADPAGRHRQRAIAHVRTRGRAAAAVPDQRRHGMDRRRNPGHRRRPDRGGARAADPGAAAPGPAGRTDIARHCHAGRPRTGGGRRRRRHRERSGARGPPEPPAGTGREVGAARREGRAGGDRRRKRWPGSWSRNWASRSPSASESVARSTWATTRSCGATARRSSPVDLVPSEHDAVRWVGDGDLDSLDWLAPDREIFTDLRRLLTG